MKYAPPTYLVVTNTTVFAAHPGDGALPDSTIVGIDRKTRTFYGVTYHCTSCADQETPADRGPLFKVTNRELQIIDFKADARAVWAKDARGTWTKLNPQTLDIEATGVKRPSG